MKTNKPFLQKITYKSENKLPNLLATHKYLGIPIRDAKQLICSAPYSVELNPPRVLESRLKMDSLIDRLKSFEIEIQVIYQ